MPSSRMHSLYFIPASVSAPLGLREKLQYYIPSILVKRLPSAATKNNSGHGLTPESVCCTTVERLTKCWFDPDPFIMTADLAPAPYHSWIFGKTTQSNGNSPQSIQSSDTFFDAEDKLRVTHSMTEIRAALEEKTEPFMNKEYLSSEEALSPMVDDVELSEDEREDMAQAEDAEELEDEMWDNIKFFNLDMAIAICIIAVGQPKTIDLGHMHTMQFGRPQRMDSLPPTVPVRHRERLPSQRLQTRFPTSSMQGYNSDLPTSADESPSNFEDSPLSFEESPLGTSYASKRHASIFNMPENPDISSTWTPPLSEQDSESSNESPTPSFLHSDPFENSKPPRSGHSRLRNISSKFSFSFQSNKEGNKTDDRDSKRLIRKERRNSLFRPLTPQSMDRISSEDERRNSHRPETPQPVFIAPLQTSPRQRTFPRMVARAADEREPAIILPPCPADYDDEDLPVQLVRSHTAFVPRKPKGMGREEHLRRRKSLLSLVS